jgi:multiple sugar transport system ATP-binding protein
MNFLSVRQNGETLEHDEFSYQISPETRRSLSETSEDLTVGIRPEHIELVDASAENAIRTTIEVIEPMGETTYAYFEVGGETYTASISGETRISAGDNVHVAFPEEKIHIFDGRSGKAIKNSELDETAAPPEA